MKTPDNSQSSPNKLPLETSHKKGEHTVAGESTLSAAASAMEDTAFSFPSIIIKKASKGIGNLGHGLLHIINHRSILIDASIAVEPTIVLITFLLLLLLLEVVAMNPAGALKPAAVETASSKASAVAGSILSQGGGKCVFFRALS